MRIGSEIPLDPDIAKTELKPSPVAPEENDDNFLGFFHRVDLEALIDWTTVTRFLGEVLAT